MQIPSEDEEFLVQIPPSRLDPRTDEEIAETLCAYRPVTSERNVWAFWDEGFLALRPWYRRNVLAWVRRLGPSWTVRVLDLVPHSPNHVHRFVAPENFPAAFNQGTMDGPNKAQHASDLTRLAVLFQVRIVSRKSPSKWGGRTVKYEMQKGKLNIRPLKVRRSIHGC